MILDNQFEIKTKGNNKLSYYRNLGYLTESQEMTKRGINKIYDCGKMKFEKIIYK